MRRRWLWWALAAGALLYLVSRRASAPAAPVAAVVRTPSGTVPVTAGATDPRLADVVRLGYIT